MLRELAGGAFDAPIRCVAPEAEPAPRLLPSLAEYKPDLPLVSAGFDAHVADRASDLRLTEDDFAWATRALVVLAAAVCDGRLVSVLEGGYHLRALARSSARHVEALLGP